MGHSPLHLTARDFDAYAPEKATSNAFTRPRLEVKQRALAWARGVVARLAAQGVAVDVHGSDEHPSRSNKKRVDCQWVYFWHDDEAARAGLDRLLDQGRSIAAVLDDPSPYTRHAFLALRLDAAGVEVCFAVHPEARVDVDNLRARLAEGEGALTAELMAALAALPDEFAIGVAEGDRVAAGAATPDALRSMIERAAAGQVPLWVGWSIKREVAVEHTEVLDDQLEDAIVALLPIYRLVAWSRDNDHIALDQRIQSADAERALAHAAASAETEKWRAEQTEARRRSVEEARARAEEQRRPAVPARRPSLETLFGPPRAPKAAPPPRPRSTPPLSPSALTAPTAPTEPTEKTAHAKHPSSAPGPAPVEKPARPRDEAAAPVDKAGGLDKGSRVRVRSGAFADKVGSIADLDGKGGARVLLGLLSTRLDLAELEPVVEGKAERPALQSSHRKPLAPPPRKAR